MTLAIITLASAGIAIAVYQHYERARADTALNDSRKIRVAVTARALRVEGASCPTVDDLVADGSLDEDSPRRDPWGNEWRIRCEEQRIAVETDGPDRARGTPDDIRVPRAGQQP